MVTLEHGDMMKLTYQDNAKRSCYVCLWVVSRTNSEEPVVSECSNKPNHHPPSGGSIKVWIQSPSDAASSRKFDWSLGHVAKPSFALGLHQSFCQLQLNCPHLVKTEPDLDLVD